MQNAAHRRSLRRTTALIATATVLAVAGCSSGSSDSGASATKSPSGSNDLQTDYQNTVNKVLPSVVQIKTANSQGSGVVYDKNGDIVTNAHVVGDQHTFEVTLANSDKPLKATLVASYPVGDLAVVKLSKPPDHLRVATFADSSKVEVGQIVLAMGNPLGLASSVTQGIVSALGRTVTEPKTQETPAGLAIPNMVQTSAPINPGNSGGALVNLADQIVGINTLAAADPQQGTQAAGIGFAIPSSTVKKLADQMIKYGKVTNSGRAALGVATRTVLSADGTSGVGAGVVTVVQGGPADKAGIEPGDVITKVDDTSIESSQALGQEIASLKPGAKVKVTVVRAGAEKTVTATLGSL